MKLNQYKLKDGQLRYEFTGYDYGYCSRDETPLTKEPGKFPFEGTENGTFELVGEVEIPESRVEWLNSIG